MVYTVCEINGVFNVTNENIETHNYDNKTFMLTTIKSLMEEDNTIYMCDLNFWGLGIIDRLRKNGMVDYTQNRLLDGSQKKPEKGCYSYSVSGENGSFYKIMATQKGTLKILPFELLVPLDDKLLKDFDGNCKSERMMNAIKAIRAIGATGSTLSSCAYGIWKHTYNFHEDFERLFGTDERIVRDAYHGGLCLVNKDKEGKVWRNGITLDVNSLYPFIMKNALFPVGEAHYEQGEPSSKILNCPTRTYFVKFKAVFQLKEGHIPFLRTCCDELHYRSEILETSDYIDFDGNPHHIVSTPGVDGCDEYGEVLKDHSLITATLCLYKTEFELFMEHYDVRYIEYIEYVWYSCQKGIFSAYVNQFYNMKKNAKNKAERRIAKMFLNALSGRMALKRERVGAYFDKKTFDMIKKRKTLGSTTSCKGKYTDHFIGDYTSDYFAGRVEFESRSESHVAVGAAITSEAMCFIVRLAQANYDHFLYTDTDSLHMDCGLDELVGIKVSDELGDFKVEHEWKTAIYYKPKIYVLDDVSEGIDVTYAGLPEEAQALMRGFLNWKVRENEYIEKYKDADYLENPFLPAIPKNEMRKPEEMSDMAWNVFVQSQHDKDLKDFFGLRIPVRRYEIVDYDTYEKIEKCWYYKVDIWSKT